jgi:Uma2 family endonuclease
MSAETAGMHMPVLVTLDDLAAMNASEVTKRREYASAGIPQYWVVDRDDAQTVTLYQLSSDGAYVERAKMPLLWLLQTTPSDHLD